MSNSALISYTKISPNKTTPRNKPIDRITPHCVVGQCSVERLGEIFAPASRQASSNYGIGVDGRVGMYCEEKDRSWCSSSGANDHRAVTIECASDTNHPYAMNDKVYAALIDLCTDICKRNGKDTLLWLGDKDKTLAYKPKENEMILTVHRWFANKSCPGDWLYSRLGDLAEKVTKALQTEREDQPMANEIICPKCGSHFIYTETTENKSEPEIPTTSALEVGDKVKLDATATVYGKADKFSGWVYNSTLYVREISGDRIVISTQKTGAITGAVDRKYLTKV